MAKKVVVIASGETERRSIPHLVAHLHDQGTSVDEVRIPPSNRPINAELAEKLVRSVWYPGPPPDKIVLLLDVDGKPPDQVVAAIRERLAVRLPAEINERVHYAHAQWHLEAWYFADADNLRGYLGRDLGRVDVSVPDEIQNPKNHLRQILDNRPYTARVSEQIARHLNPETIAFRSGSFRGFLEAVLNGGLTSA